MLPFRQCFFSSLIARRNRAPICDGGARVTARARGRHLSKPWAGPRPPRPPPLTDERDAPELGCSVTRLQRSLSSAQRPTSDVLLLAGRRTAFVGAGIPPPAVVTRERLWSDTEWTTDIGRWVPPLTRVACQGLWSDPERPTDLARRIPPLAVSAVGLADRRCRDRHGCHRRERHHDGGNKTANECLHLRAFPSWYVHYRTEPRHRGQDLVANREQLAPQRVSVAE